MRLKDRVCIVTGGASGIGRGIALRLAEEGAHIAVADILADGAEETAQMVRRLGRHSLPLCVDVSNSTDVAMMVRRTLETFGRIDILVNNAGVMGSRPLLEISEQEWDQMIDVNLKGPFLCSQAVVRYFLEEGVRGKIVNIASVESEIVFPNSAHYAASKGGLAMLTKALAYDLAPFGICTNAVGPGSIDNGRNFQDPERRSRYQTMVPMGRLGTPRDIGNAVVFLVSDEADYVTGHVFFVDGGLLTY